MTVGPRCPKCGWTIERMLREGLEVTGLETGSATREFIVHDLIDGEIDHEGFNQSFDHDGKSPYIACGNCGHEWRTRSLRMGLGR